MSWSASITLNHEHTEIGWQRDLDALNTIVPSGNDQCPKERDEQVEVAKDAAFRMICNNPVYANAEEIIVSMSGHANKDHLVDPTSSNEFVSVQVIVKKYR